MLVVPGLAVDVLCEDGDHIFVRVGVHMVHRVALVEHVCDQIRLGHIGNGRGDHIWHISVIPVFGNVELGIRVELSNACQMDITTAKFQSVARCSKRMNRKKVP